MKLEEAIEIVNDCMSETEKILYPECLTAHNLLIEAGKYIIYRDNCPGINTRLLLPGETEE